jgi:short subunit dehydrogenase
MNRAINGSGHNEGPMRIRFDGKTVVISGAGHGFGRCIAETFAQLGARVFGCDLFTEELADTAKAGVTTQVPDLTDRAAAAAWIAQIEQTTGGAVDVLDDNSGGVAAQEMDPIGEVRDADWDRVLRGQHRCRPRVEPGNGGGHEASRKRSNCQHRFGRWSRPFADPDPRRPISPSTESRRPIFSL